ncbi:DinB family protein [Tunturiibacter gelidoferens]|uniref:Damage-inducible protein DinB n=1 Tax=Tunturiibacter gelidiferens TaxID=3069689 RepID=A0ACC5NTX4_9BACT|nr:DinB family protein [Edaphobacter lichenicola]MBB5337995.1 putative damage-inducible protein DinB [Edaphobacter lichenicola]
MTIAEILLQDFDTEISNTRRTLERVPENKNNWKCHDKSMPLGRLAMHCATLPMFGYYILEDDGMDMATSKRPHMALEFTTRENALKQLEECSAKCRASLASASDERLSTLWKFSYGEQVISHKPRSQTFREMCFDHLIHHTAQVGVYLRLNDIPVPALYGPSADEQWSA